MERKADPRFLVEVALSARSAAMELCEAARLVSGQIVVIGCSTSEIAGHRLGTNSSTEIGEAVFAALFRVFDERRIRLAVQCCEHLNRAIITQRDASSGFELVNVVPSLEAGGAFAVAAYATLDNPVALEEIRADAGIDIGGTLIGMHLKKVAVPLRLGTAFIGKASVTAARTRPKFIGGARAKYDESLL